MPNPNYKYKDGKIKIKINDSWIEPIFEQYENLMPIGEPGANGVVIKGTHKITGRDDAIKIWLPREQNGKNEVRVEQYIAEVQKVAKLNDERIVTIHNAWIENDCYCCSMEFIDGITYKKWLELNTDMNKRVYMLLKIFDAIVFYQSQGIIHGDIHTKNIMIDKKEKIHIIDFGTSSLSAYKEQSKDRENYLMYELVEKTMEDQFDNRAFGLKKYSINGTIKNNDDVRTAIPVLFSKSIISYLNLYIMITNLHDILKQSEDIYEYCRNIVKGFYLNMDYYFMKITGKNERKMERFINVMFESLEYEVYEEAQNDYDEADRMEYLSLYVYFEDVKRGLKAGKISDRIKKDCIENRFKNESELVIQGINNSEDLFSFHGYLLERIKGQENIYAIETDLRGCLYNILKSAYGGYLLHILRNQYLRITEIKMNEGLYNRVIQLSYIYRANNGISS